MSTMQRAAVPVVLVLLLLAGAVVMFTGGEEDKTATAYFPRTVSLYEGSDVRVLGVPVGQIDSITPEGVLVRVEMSYDPKVQIPADARAAIVSPAIVGDRYVQLTPAFKKGDKVLADGARLGAEDNQVPLELDEIYANLDRLTVALGPDGANSEGALTDLLQVTAANFDGQGENFHTAIDKFGDLSATLENNKEELFGSTAELQRFITTLAENDSTVRGFNNSLGRVSQLLADERQELVAALRNLAVALDEVGGFVRDNRELLGKNIRGLNRVAKVLVKQRAALDETLRIAPLALNNLQLTYNPDTGTLDTNANLGNLIREIETSPTAVLCALVSANDENGELCDLIEGLPLPRAATFGPGTGSSSNVETDPSLGGVLGTATSTDEGDDR